MKNKELRLKYAAGISLMEVLVTMLIILIGLLGIVALQGKAHVAELESYQRSQALIMLSDIVDRINVNRATASCFNITTNTAAGTPYLGTISGGGHYTPPDCTAATSAYNTQAVNNLAEIDSMLQGSAESMGGSNVGAMIGARACISYDSSTELGGSPGTGLYTVIVTWQGMSALAAPTGMKCAVGLYQSDGLDNKRRAVAATFRLANLY